MLLPETRCKQGFFLMVCNWVQVSFKDLFFLFILMQPLCSLLSPGLLLCFSQSLWAFHSLSLWTNCVNNLIWAAAQKQRKIEAKCFIATISSFLITGPGFQKAIYCHTNFIQIRKKKRNREWKRHQMNYSISCWQRLLEEWMNFLMERIHGAFYQAF